MNRADRRAWKQARTLTELGELAARWLEGDIASQPGYRPNCGPARETAGLIPTLARLNRAGYYTVGSQPGLAPTEGHDGRVWTQRAAVTGFADDDTWDRIRTAVERARQLVLIAHRTPPRGRVWTRPRRLRGAGMAITTAGDRVHTQFGARMSLGDIEGYLWELGQEGFAAVRGALQVTVIDPVWGRDDVLWSVLNTVVGDRIGVER